MRILLHIECEESQKIINTASKSDLYWIFQERLGIVIEDLEVVGELDNEAKPLPKGYHERMVSLSPQICELCESALAIGEEFNAEDLVLSSENIRVLISRHV